MGVRERGADPQWWHASDSVKRVTVQTASLTAGYCLGESSFSIHATTPIGAFFADYNETHIFNPNWPPQAKFHGGQTLSMSVVLGLMTVVFAWRKTRDQISAVIAASGFAAAYYVSQGAAILYPGTAFFDPQFVTPNSYPLGIALQLYIEAGYFLLIGLASWLALRRGAISAHRHPRPAFVP